jgi:hypothetical protein
VLPKKIREVYMTINNSSFTVQANQTWQLAGIDIPVGVPVMVNYQTGEWTANPDSNGGVLYNANGAPGLIVPSSKTSYPLSGAQEGALVGRVGDTGSPFVIGDGPTSIPVGDTGQLQLVINDDLTGTYGAGLTDNRGSITVFIYAANTTPDLTVPLVHDPAQASPGLPSSSQLGPLEHFIGTWTNQTLVGATKGGPDAPYSYNVMPLPQVDPSSPDGYILKNFSYFEELTFSAIHGAAPNRSGTGTQTPNVLFYEQRVYFADGPNKDALVHAENGSLLFIQDNLQLLGPYGNGTAPGIGNQTVENSVAPSQDFSVVKQVSVPHGNSILAPGDMSTGTSSPTIPTISTLPPPSVNSAQYLDQNPVSNPNARYAVNPNQALVDALSVNSPTSFIALNVSSANGSGAVTNIGFENANAKVTQYACTYWLEAFSGSENYTQLQYSQNISMQINVNGEPIVFPHVTTNTMTKVQS